MSALWQDIRHGLRILVRYPGFTAASILTLAIVLGANTAVFSVMYGVLLRPLPFPGADRLADLSVDLPPSEGLPSRKAYLDGGSVESLREGARTIARVAAYRSQSFTVRDAERSEKVNGALVEAALFPLLDVSPARGSTFGERDLKRGSGRAVVLSYDLWQERFQSASDIVDKAITVDNEPYTVLGVMPEGFFFPSREAQLWMLLDVDAPADTETNGIATQYYPVVIRLRAGVAFQAAEAEAQAILRHTAAAQPGMVDELSGGRVQLAPLRDAMVVGVRPALIAMFAAVALVLLIACLNLANLLLARNASRLQEMAIRSTLGGGRARLMRQMLTESMVLSIIGGLCGLVVAGWVSRFLPLFLPQEIPRLAEVRFDTRVFFFALLLSAVTGVLFGLLPALRSSSTSLARDLSAGSTATAPGSAFRGSLVVADIALALVLLTGAGLLVRNFIRLLRIDLGYQPHGLLTATLNLDPTRWSAPGRSAAFFDDLLSALRQSPDVQAASVVSFPPLTPNFSLTSLSVVGQPPARTMAVPQLTSPEYLRTMGLQVVEGRWLSAQDQATESRVVVVNETFVRRYLAELDPVGQRLQLGASTWEVVGVVEDVRLLGLESDPKAEVYASYRLAREVPGALPTQMTVVLRGGSSPMALIPLLRKAAFKLDPTLALEDVRPLEAKLSASLAQPRFYALLLAGFGGMALVLAVAGVYGVLAYSVSRQTRAIGIRRALGAREWDILALVLGRGLVLVSLGLLLGTAASLAAARVLAHLLFGVSTKDPLSFIAAAITLGSAALIACYLPARRATRIEPLEALNQG